MEPKKLNAAKWCVPPHPVCYQPPCPHVSLMHLCKSPCHGFHVFHGPLEGNIFGSQELELSMDNQCGFPGVWKEQEAANTCGLRSAGGHPGQSYIYIYIYCRYTRNAWGLPRGNINYQGINYHQLSWYQLSSF